MKSPHQLAEWLTRQWQRGDWREQHLLHNPSAWPLRLPIGAPDAKTFRDDSATLRQHLQAWQTIANDGPGTVHWQVRNYRSGRTPIPVPAHWELARPSDVFAAINHFTSNAGAQAAADYQVLTQVLARVDACFHRLLLRRLALWRGMSAEQIITAARLALQLAPGCAQGKPLRALALAGNDSKFMERHASLLTALLDQRFDGEASRQGLEDFLAASANDEHWLLVVPLAKGLLPFARQRVPVSELQTTPLGAHHILLVENERSLHQLPRPLPDTIAILGAGLDLGWLATNWLQNRRVAYWGDLDTWGLGMLATARRCLPHLHALLMDRATFDTHQDLAVSEPVTANQPEPGTLLPEEFALDQHLRTLARGRLEQEFLPSSIVAQAIEDWRLTD